MLTSLGSSDLQFFEVPAKDCPTSAIVFDSSVIMGPMILGLRCGCPPTWTTILPSQDKSREMSIWIYCSATIWAQSLFKINSTFWITAEKAIEFLRIASLFDRPNVASLARSASTWPTPPNGFGCLVIKVSELGLHTFQRLTLHPYFKHFQWMSGNINRRRESFILTLSNMSSDSLTWILTRWHNNLGPE